MKALNYSENSKCSTSFKNALKASNSKEFGKIVSSKTDKDLNWFFGNYVNTDKDIDYTTIDIDRRELIQI